MSDNPTLIDNPKLMAALPMLRDEFDKALTKHPAFPLNEPEMVAVMMEELGEVAKEINDAAPGWRERALVEMAHVAVTAIRSMNAMMDKAEAER